MSRTGSADGYNGAASGEAASDASHAFPTHVSSASRGYGTQASSPAKYDKTAAILLGWKEECCDTGVAKEVSFHSQPSLKLTFS